MAHLTRPERYNIEDTNIALLGSDLEKRVREHAGDKDAAWETAGRAPGIEIWRVEKFKIVPWPAERKGVFYDGDSYVVLHTYKKTPDSEELLYDLHFWLGDETSQDEAGTAAYKTVELDDHLHGAPVQYREVQSFESPRFLSYFPHFVTLDGGVSTGFHHVSAPPPLELHRLYHIKAIAPRGGGHGIQFVTRQVSAMRNIGGGHGWRFITVGHFEIKTSAKPDAASVKEAEGDVLVLDKGLEIWQFNRKNSAGKERFRASEFVRNIVDERQKAGHAKNIDVKVFDEGVSGAGIFLAELGTDAIAIASPSVASSPMSPASLFRLSDATGAFTLTVVPSSPPRLTDFSSADIFIFDNLGDAVAPAVYVWIGKEASVGERRMGVQFAQTYLRRKTEGNAARRSIVKVNEGRESEPFLQALEA